MKTVLFKCIWVLPFLVMLNLSWVHAQNTLSHPEGIWQGKLKLPGTDLRIFVQIKATAPGVYKARLASPDQGATDIPVEKVTWVHDTLILDVKAVSGTYTAVFQADSVAFEGIWKQAGQAFPLVLKKGDAASLVPNRPQNPKKPFPYREEDVIFENPEAGLKLGGTLTLPAGKGPFPVALLISGSGAQNRDEELMGHKPFLVLADHLTRQGIAVLRVDDRGIGKSTGDFIHATSADFATDAAAGVRYLQTRKEINPKQIGLIGHSEGGMIAPLVATEYAKNIAFMVLMAGIGTTGENLHRQQTERMMQVSGSKPEEIQKMLLIYDAVYAHIRTEANPDTLEKKLFTLLKKEPYFQGTDVAAISKKFASPWFRYFFHYDPVPVLRKVKCPVLAINGEKDVQVLSQVNLTAIAQALKAGGNTQVTTKELPGLNHLFQTAPTGQMTEYAQIEETLAPVALQTISDWIRSQTKATK